MLRFSDYQTDAQLVKSEDDERNRVLKVFNKKRKDFSSQDEYDSYLEKAEDYIFVLVDKKST
jgi:hypothetical protein